MDQPISPPAPIVPPPVVPSPVIPPVAPASAVAPRRSRWPFFGLVGAILLAGVGYFWWQAGFSFDFSRFFAAAPVACPNGYQDWGGGICWKITNSTTLTTAACQSPQAGAMSQTWDVINNSTDAYYVIFNGFHDPIQGCSANATAPSGGQTITNGNFLPGDHHTVTLTYQSGTHTCGRTQLDACFKNGTTGKCRDTSGGLALGAAINYGKNCPGVTPTPTPTTSCVPVPSCVYQGPPFCAFDPIPGVNYCPRPSTTVIPPSPVALACSPSQQSVGVGQSASLSASGGGGTYNWFAPGGSPATAAGGSLAVSYATPGHKTVTLAGPANQVTCVVNVSEVVVTTITPPPTTITPPPSTITPPPTTPPPTTPILSLQKTARNITQNGTEADTINAAPSDTVEFILRVSSTGSADATNVIVRDVLPSGLAYQAGSTTIDNVPAADGILGTGLNVGTMAPGRTIAIRFRATVADVSFFPIGSTSLVNTGYVRSDSTAEISDTAFVNVVRGQVATTMTLTKLGRNITHGQTGEHSSVNASPADMIGFFIHVRNTSSVALTNVIVRDIVPQGITYTAGSARLNNQPMNDTLVGTGVNIGTLNPGAQALVTFTGQGAGAAAFPVGTTTLINTAQASADGVSTMNAQLPIIITNSGSVPQVPTGPGESTVLALIVSAIATLLYVGYTGTTTYRQREALGLMRKAAHEKDLMNFKK